MIYLKGFHKKDKIYKTFIMKSKIKHNGGKHDQNSKLFKTCKNQ